MSLSSLGLEENCDVRNGKSIAPNADNTQMLASRPLPVHRQKEERLLNSLHVSLRPFNKPPTLLPNRGLLRPWDKQMQARTLQTPALKIHALPAIKYSSLCARLRAQK